MTPEHLWNLLRQVRSLAFVARSGAATGWNGEGGERSSSRRQAKG
jgi:hypothetical protein